MMTQALSSSRKRVRGNNCEEECCDFMPLSKRINNLHINNGSCCSGLALALAKHADFEQGGTFDECHRVDNSIIGHSSEPVQLPFVPDPGSSMMPPDIHHCNPHQGDNNNDIYPPGVHGWISNQVLSLYSPDLDATDNPYYYETNKLLFALYMERLQRSGH